jgi:hypothetical protein
VLRVAATRQLTSGWRETAASCPDGVSGREAEHNGGGTHRRLEEKWGMTRDLSARSEPKL